MIKNLQSIKNSIISIQNLTSPTPPLFIYDYPLNLSISISGGKENNCDCLSNGE